MAVYALLIDFPEQYVRESQPFKDLVKVVQKLQAREGDHIKDVCIKKIPIGHLKGFPNVQTIVLASELVFGPFYIQSECLPQVQIYETRLLIIRSGPQRSRERYQTGYVRVYNYWVFPLS